MNKMLKLAVLAGLVIGTTDAFANEIELLRAESYVLHGSSTVQVPTIDAVLNNLGPVKQVFVHTQISPTVWVDVPMSYNRPAGAGQEVWTAAPAAFKTGNSVTNGVFALKYVVDGKTYWDNNNGNNYHIAADSGDILPTFNVFDGSYGSGSSLVCGKTAAETTVVGDVTVRNIAFAKAIKLVYTTDGWKTKHTVVATYSPSFWIDQTSTAANPNQYGFEQWSYSVPVGAATQLQYAVSYTVNGQTYWDNNFGHNYTVNTTCP